MKRTAQFALASILLPIVVGGCTSLRDQSTGYIPEWRARVDALTTNDIPFPTNTPFDPTNSLRQVYLEGYAEGIEYAKRILDYGPIGIVRAAENEQDRARFIGWKNGRYAASLMIAEVQKEVEADAIQVHSNGNQEVGYHSNGRLWYLWQYDTDARGSNTCIARTEWFQNGNMSEQWTYDSDGNPVGQVKRWYRNGNLWQVDTWSGGEVDGRCEGFYPNGARMYSLTCRESIPEGKARIWNSARQLIARGVFRDGEWTETFRVPGYIIDVPMAEVTEHAGYTYVRPEYHFSVEIDPRGPIADDYHRFLEQTEGETNAVVEIRDDEDGLMILTGASATNGMHYYLQKEGDGWKVDGKGKWEKSGNSCYFYTIKGP